MITTTVAALLVAAVGAAANPVDLDPRQVGSQVSTGNNLCLDLRGGNTADGTAAQL